MARLGDARQGAVRPGRVWHGRAGIDFLARLGVVWRGMAGLTGDYFSNFEFLGAAWKGKVSARRGMARRGKARQGIL